MYDEDLSTGERVLRKRLPVLGDFDPAQYTSERQWAEADDGTLVPISLVWRPDRVPRDGPAPCLLYGYGAYEASMDPWFSSFRLSLLDRGVVFGIAHVRGGGELGRHWYEDGKLGHKGNSFTDFVACARHLVATGRTAPDRLAARGGSAGGLLMGGVANLAPELFRVDRRRGAVRGPVEHDAGPDAAADRDRARGVGRPDRGCRGVRLDPGVQPVREHRRAVPYPAILATAGLNDPRVGYHEPTKWVARLRDRSADATGVDRPVLLKVEMGAGHGGPSGRYESWKDEAFVLAFVLDALAVSPARRADGRSQPTERRQALELSDGRL